jgi:hypothetical protein
MQNLLDVKRDMLFRIRDSEVCRQKFENLLHITKYNKWLFIDYAYYFDGIVEYYSGETRIVVHYAAIPKIDNSNILQVIDHNFMRRALIDINCNAKNKTQLTPQWWWSKPDVSTNDQHRSVLIIGDVCDGININDAFGHHFPIVRMRDIDPTWHGLDKVDDLQKQIDSLNDRIACLEASAD